MTKESVALQPVPNVLEEPADASPEEGDSAEVHQQGDGDDEHHAQEDAHGNDADFIAGQPFAAEPALKRFQCKL